MLLHRVKKTDTHPLFATKNVPSKTNVLNLNVDYTFVYQLAVLTIRIHVLPMFSCYTIC